ncbi:hypothetical protein ACHQM5_012319 [Ranunculus cassubicifolius]
MKMATKPFKGSNIYLSRNLVQPELFDSIHDALKLNGATVYQCCDPSRSGLNDYHIISSPLHEKFEHLKTKGCKLLGPECVLSCAKENRSLPTQKGFTCCLAMDGVKVLASGFDKEEKVKIEELVTAMGGAVLNKASMEVSFVVVKNVLAAKYRWALTVLKKPIVTISWIYQCWKEHRVVPQEMYRVLPFSGLTICVTRVKADLRKEMENLILNNGGKYSADLTKKCTHLVSDAPEGDKYKVAKKWGHVHLVTRRWIDQSIGRKACLDEGSYPVQVSSTSSAGVGKGGMVGGQMGEHSQDKGYTYSESFQSSIISELEITMPQDMSSTFSDSTIFTKDNDSEVPNLQPGDETEFSGLVADDSQTEDNDFYLSDCRILFVGFQASELRKLVNLVRKGGGSRCMSFSEEKLTHIVVGAPSENEKKEIRYHVALGMIYAVKAVWLEDCDREKKEVPVSQKHLPDLLPPKAVSGTFGINRGKSPLDASVLPSCQMKTDMTFDTGLSSENDREKTFPTNLEVCNRQEQVAQSGRQDNLTLNDEFINQNKVHPSANTTTGQESKISNIFKGLQFRFSSSFPEDRRAEIVDWVHQGGGVIVDGYSKQTVQFTIAPHGLLHKSSDVSQTTIVSTHWIRFCLEAGCMPDIGSHIIYSPLPCRVPFPGFESFRFCVSQYEVKDRLLLKNLCVVLGAKFTEKLTKRVTHLFCKFSNGPKYDAACNWGKQPVTSEWITECIRQDKIVPLDPFRPKSVTAQDQDAGLCTISQYPTQAARMMSEDAPSQFQSQTQGLKKVSVARKTNSSKRARNTEGDNYTELLPAKLNEAPTVKVNTGEVSYGVPIYGSASKMSIEPGTSELISQCMRQDPLIPVGSFRQEDAGIPKEGQCPTPTEAAQVVSREVPSQFPTHSRVPENLSSNGGYKIPAKRARLTDNGNLKDTLPAEVQIVEAQSSSADAGEVPDVASAIEDLLAQSNKMQDMSTPGMNGSDQNIFSSDCSMLAPHHVDSSSVFGISNHWINRPVKQHDLGNATVPEVKQGPYDGFSETQTESQVVMYEDDLSGRQRIIERVQTRSSLT